MSEKLRLTIIAMLASDQSTPYRVFLGLHDVFHYRKSHIPLHTGCFMTLTSRLAGYGIILHVCRHVENPRTMDMEISKCWRQEQGFQHIQNNITDSLTS